MLSFKRAEQPTDTIEQSPELVGDVTYEVIHGFHLYIKAAVFCIFLFCVNCAVAITDSTINRVVLIALVVVAFYFRPRPTIRATVYHYATGLTACSDDNCSNRQESLLSACQNLSKQPPFIDWLKAHPRREGFTMAWRPCLKQ